MVSAWCQKWDSNWQLVKLQLTCEDNAFLWFYIGSSKEIFFFLNTQLKLVQKREPLFWKYTVCKLLKCNNKISLFDLIMRSQSGKGEVGMFVLSIHCMKRSPTSKNMILRKGKKIHERWIFPFSSACHMGAPSLAIPSEAPKSRHTILMPVQGKSMKSISLQLISNQKYTPKLSTALHKIQKTRPWGVIVQPLGTET